MAGEEIINGKERSHEGDGVQAGERWDLERHDDEGRWSRQAGLDKLCHNLTACSLVGFSPTLKDKLPY